MSYTPDLRPNRWTTLCAVCGFRFNSNELKERWDGVMVCDKDWEPRNVLDFFKIPAEDISVPWTYPEHLTLTNYASITATDSPYTATVTIVQLDVNATAGNITINLPTANTYTFADSQQLNIRRSDATTNSVTVQRQGGDTINGTTSITIPISSSRIFQNDAVSAWRTI